jgi:hypothetical protein
VKEGKLAIPEDILNRYANIGKKEINITGKNPFDPYEPALAMEDIMISGKVIGVDTVLCDESNCVDVPVFKVEKWSVGSYYPRHWIHGKLFLITFLISTLLSTILALLFIGIIIKKLMPKLINSC